MKRHIQNNLDQWFIDPLRKPLILRGARQVGKTWLVRDLAVRQKKDLIEFNFEREPAAQRLFLSNDPAAILGEISLWLGRVVIPENSIIFLDEIQAADGLLAKLRWFAEEMPQIPLIAAGSLLEFTLADHTFSMPVGRVSFMHIEPMIFSEFLIAHGQELLLERLTSWKSGTEFSPVLHTLAHKWFHRYCMVGGMPAVVNSDITGSDARKIRDIQYDLTATYRADFTKYNRKFDNHVLEATLLAIAASIGKKFIYSHIHESIKQTHARQALDMLNNARICQIVKHSSANGIPLGGEIKDSFRKIILNDIGIFHALLRTPAQSVFPALENIAPQIRSQMIEQIAGQQFRNLGQSSGDGPDLFYWQREGGRPGEIDYLLQIDDKIVPVELKSGVAGSMKSLHQFMYDKKLDFALRFDQNPPSLFDVSVKTTQGNPVRYRLKSLPCYFLGIGENVLRND